MSKLTQKKCEPCEGGTEPLNRKEAEQLMRQLDPGWEIDDGGRWISKDFRFKGYYRTMSFVNAVAWIANAEDHHPDLEVGYGHCLVRFTTHAINGLSMNDFICAAKIDRLQA